VIEEPALGNAGRRDQLLDRRGAEAFLEDRRLGQRKDALAGVALPFCAAGLHGGLYLWSSCASLKHGKPRATALPADANMLTSRRDPRNPPTVPRAF